MRFSSVKGLVRKDLETLGLFRTRLPQFPQMFFYDFNEAELTLGLGQASGPLTSFRAARAYLKCGVRLESKCGLSDVWYHYVEANRDAFGVDRKEPPSASPTPPAPHPQLDPVHMPLMWDALRWYDQHEGLSESKVTTILADDSSDISEFTTGDWGCTDASPLEDVDASHNDDTRVSEIEEEGQDLPEQDANSDGTGDEQKPKIESGMQDDEYGLHLPLDDELFKSDLFELLDNFGTTSHLVTNAFVPSSIPEEQSLHLNPGVEVDDVGDHTPMEGVEASQPTDSGVVGVSDRESEEDMRMEDLYVPDGERR